MNQTQDNGPLFENLPLDPVSELTMTVGGVTVRRGSVVILRDRGLSTVTRVLHHSDEDPSVQVVRGQVSDPREDDWEWWAPGHHISAVLKP